MTHPMVLIGTALTLAGCTGLFFYPSPNLIRTPADVGLRYEERSIGDEGSARLTGWFLPADGTPQGTVVFLHGNAENISTHFGQVHWLPRAGYQVFLFDYGGYGHSTGTPSVDSVHEDAARMVRAVLKDSRVNPANLFLLGQSLGASVALYTAAREEFNGVFRAVIADSPFSSYRSIAREKVGSLWLTAFLRWPLGFLVRDEYSPERVISAIAVPVLFIHGTADVVVPPHHSTRLCKLLGDRCIRWEIAGAAHGVPLSVPEVRRRVVEFMDATKGPRIILTRVLHNSF